MSLWAHNKKTFLSSRNTEIKVSNLIYERKQWQKKNKKKKNIHFCSTTEPCVHLVLQLLLKNSVSWWHFPLRKPCLYDILSPTIFCPHSVVFNDQIYLQRSFVNAAPRSLCSTLGLVSQQNTEPKVCLGVSSVRKSANNHSRWNRLLQHCRDAHSGSSLMWRSPIVLNVASDSVGSEIKVF